MSVRLVAEREIRQQLQSKAFRIATGLLVAIIIAVVVVPSLVGDEPRSRTVGVAGKVTAAQREAVVAAGRLTGAKVRVARVAGTGAAEQAVRSGDLDLAVVDGPGLIVKETLEPESDLGRLAGAISQALGLQAELERAGLPPADATRALAAPPLPVRSLDPPDPNQEDGAGLAFVGSLVLYVLLLTYGSWIVTAVVQEKSSRVVEVLLAAVRPVDLLVGKVLGIGAVALGQGLVFSAAALGASAAVGLDQLPDATPLAIASTLLWLVLGFGLYSFAFATAGSLASRQEDAQSASLPLTVALLLAYFAGAAAGVEPRALVPRLLSFFPPTAPIVMPARVAAGGVDPWETPVAVLLVLASIYGMARLAAHIYPRVALQSGARLKLRAAWRSGVA